MPNQVSSRGRRSCFVIASRQPRPSRRVGVRERLGPRNDR